MGVLRHESQIVEFKEPLHNIKNTDKTFKILLFVHFGANK